TVHHGNFCAVGYHNPKREKVSGPMGSNPLMQVAQQVAWQKWATYEEMATREASHFHPLV
ncbi:hypothetical protein, partial [Aeromonas caviae]|uniref:hypothetical protein n=1 Tax=Aeromonas caviae TaxID=648 RepID=UPI0030149601